MRAFAAATILAVGLITPLHDAAADNGVTVSHALTLLDKPKYGPDFKHLDYVNPDAPKGGTVRLSAIGSFDSFNEYIIKGDAVSIQGRVVETLMTSPMDDVSTEYGLIAKSVEVPDDLSYVIYNLRPEARFHDGHAVTAEDVVFSFDTLKKEGAPHYRFYYANITRAVALDPHKVRFEFTGPPNRELPQITGQLPVLPKHYWEKRDFTKTTLEPPLGSGPYKMGNFEPGRFIEFVRVDDYWGRDLPINVGTDNFDLIRYDYYRDPTVVVEAFKAGQYDFRLENSSKDWATQYDFPAVKRGLVVKAEEPHERPTGMQSFVFNLRRDKFRDPLVREAIGFAFDFEWSNNNLFYGQYTRTESYFSNSELAAREKPSPEELKILEPYRGKVPDEVFTTVYDPPETDGSGNNRENLRKAIMLLRKAGWSIENGALVDPKTKQPVQIEILLVSPAFERIVAPFINNLRRIGINGRIRTVDSSQYINRVRAFDYDMIVHTWAQSESPGNEQRDFWSSEAADRSGSQNYAGIKNPVVDELIEKIVAARTRQELVTVTKALDRVLLWNHYVVPQWHVRVDRIAYWNKFGRPAKKPKYGVAFDSWWIDQGKAQETVAKSKELEK